MSIHCESGRALRLRAGWAAALAAALFAAGSLQVKAQYSSMAPTMDQQLGRSLKGEMTENPLNDERVLKALNADRQKSMVSDANKLLRLVNELDAEIAKSNDDTLTDAEMRKVAKIEKLAHNVKEKMSTSVRGTPAYRPPDVHVR